MDKPLPELPPNQTARGLKHIQSTVNWATLSIDAQAHLRSFILYALEEERDALPEDEWEEWAVAVEHGLAELGERISLGGWLVGIRRARVRRMQERAERLLAKRNQSTDTLVPRKDEGGSVKGKSAQPQPAQDEPGSYFSLSRHTGKSAAPPTQSIHSTLANQTAEQPLRERLQTLRAHALQPAAPTPKPTAKHLLLTVAPLGVTPVIHQDDEDEYVFPHSQLACVFVPGVYTLPQAEDLEEDEHGAILYGLDSWDAQPWTAEIPLQVVGGTFSFRGVTSNVQHAALTKVLRLSVFSYLSSLLEQSFFADSHVSLRYPKPSLSQRTAAADGSISRALSTGHVGKQRKRDSGTGLFAFFSRKKDNLLQRAVPVRRGSLELPLVRKPSARERSRSPVTRTSEDSAYTRSRRFSFISDYRPSFMHAAPKEPEHVERPFTAALARIEKARSMLSTSAGITFDPPDLLVRLAAREKRNPDLRLGGDEKAALTGLLGWEGKRSVGAGMADTAGFVRHQSFSILYSEYIPHSTPASSRPVTPNGSQTSSTLSTSTPAKTILCGRRRKWMTYRFYSRDGGADECLGEAIMRLCSRAEEPCDEPGCQFKKGEHELRYTHGGIRILVNIGNKNDSKEVAGEDDDLPEMWESCSVCSKESIRCRMQDATYLLSFAKYLEVLTYSTNMCTLSPPICSHTTPPPRPWSASDSPLPRSRLNIVRHFSVKGRTISYSLCEVKDIYEVRVPRLQILRTRNCEAEESDESRQALEADRRKLRREIMQFWQALSEQMDTLEGTFLHEHAPTYHKSLPRLPSADDAYSSFDDDGLITPKGLPSKLPPLPPNTPRTPVNGSGNPAYPFPPLATPPKHAETRASTPDVHPPTPSAISTSTASSEQDSLALLTHLRHTFQRTEQNLYAELSRTPNTNLNDVRRSFVSAARGATKRLSAWETKHTSGQPTVPEAVAQNEPEWWQSGCHAVPGGNVIVREDDWGSIIAFTLSSLDYHKELANMTINRTAVVPPVPPPTPDITRPSFFTKNSSSKWFGSAPPTPDPDQDDAGWHEPETYSAVISRKEHPRDPTSILKLGIPDVLRPKAGDSLAPSTLKASSPGAPSAWAKPDVQVSRQEADGQLSAVTPDRIDKVLHELEAAAEPQGAHGIQSTVRSAASDARTSASSAFVETNIRRGKASSIMSSSSSSTDIAERSTSAPPPPPPKDTQKDAQRGEKDAPPRSAPATPLDPGTPQQQPPAGATVGFTSTLSSALKYVLRAGGLPTPPAKHHHALLSAGGGSPAIDERPHIKYDWTIGRRLKFSCTVYYAKQFDALRRRCGIDDMFLHSLSRSKNWLAEGGKSKSNFWKTTDNQFIIKTLVNAWNVADLHVLIELGPAYFRYVDATANKPTVLAKLLGFYTVEIKNLETGATQAKADLLVMENLFYRQEIVKTFDLKGIQGRKVKAASSSSGSKTLFDGDWIEGQQRGLTLVQPYSKVVLQEAIRADCEFLAKSNIMDYSLLVGIDESRKQIACGLVDTIGSYTFAKTLEYKAKQGLHSGKEVTVIPPNEYQERFINAMDNYFVACPDKWSRPQDDTKIPGDYRQLPSVL